MSAQKAIQTAQRIIDSTVDIRPAMAGKIVANVERAEGPHHVKVIFTDGDHTGFTGLFAAKILEHLPNTD